MKLFYKYIFGGFIIIIIGLYIFVMAYRKEFADLRGFLRSIIIFQLELNQRNLSSIRFLKHPFQKVDSNVQQVK